MVRSRPKRVYYHETRDVCDGLPDLLGRFPLRALLVARPGERVVLPAGFVPAELPLLNRLGFGPRDEDLIFVREDGSIASGDGDLEGAQVLPFSGTTKRARAFAERHGAEFHAPRIEDCLGANSKGTFQEIVNCHADERGAIGPCGVVPRWTRTASVATAFALRYGKAVVKGIHSASGLQQVVCEAGGTPSFEGMPKQVVVQEWVEHDYSPSLQCLIDASGPIRQLSTTVQILDGNHHIGNRCPSGLPDWVLEGMRWRAEIIGTELRKDGFWGICGIDFLVREQDKTVLANEVNARIPAPWYPWNASRRLLGEPLAFRMKSVSLAVGTAAGDIEKAMRPLLFDRAKRRGFVPFCLVPEHGFVYGVTYAPTPAALDALTPAVDARLGELAG
ncbi:MAG TPA: ATP-grasp domain-containing protein [Candidatus Binatia bacterium]|jgi:hypothetical protein|nr:ATP-grasp domain-containing protein [Candidatus Binatia bacterium]